jgi:hypothetical protein
MSFTESIVEDASLESFGALGHAVWNRPRLAPGEPAAEWNRSAAEMDGVNSFGKMVLVGRLREAIRRLNAPTSSLTLTLATQRDTIPPKLLSGKLSVRASEESMEATV